MEKHGIRLNLEHFGIVGEDVGFLATLFQAGLDAFTMPSFAYDYLANEGENRAKEGDTNSLIRTPGVATLLSEYEHHCLLQYEMGKHYLRVCPKGGEEYEWGEVDWRALAKFRGTQMKRVLWEPDHQRETLMKEIL